MQLLTPYQYILVDIANAMGLDKLSWDDRIQWTKDNDHKLESLVDQAETPPMFYGAVQALRDVQQGKPTGWGVSLDATASGAQILALLAGCEASASLCNVINVGARMDLYTAIYEAMLAETGGDSKITRADCKAAILTSLYGSMAQPVRVFGTGEMLTLFYKTMETRMTGAWSLNKDLISLWQDDVLTHSWVMPDGFEVEIPVEDLEAKHITFMGAPVQVDIRVNKPTDKGLSLPANVTHSVDGMILRELHRRCSYDPETVERVLESLLGTKTTQTPEKHKHHMVSKLWSLYEQSGFLSTRILDYIDSDTVGLVEPKIIKELVLSLPEKPFDMLSTHDCFRVLPAYANDLRIQYNHILADIARSTMLPFIVSQIVGAPVKHTKTADLYAAVLETNYALS
jgi:hypothetical protein